MVFDRTPAQSELACLSLANPPRSRQFFMPTGLALCAAIALSACSSGKQTAPQQAETGGPTQTAPMASLQDIANAKDPLDHGRQLYGYWCASCHGVGKDHPGTSALAHKYASKKPAALEQRSDLTPNLVRYYVRTGVSIMPFFRKTEINDKELDDIGQYLSRNVPKVEK